MNLCEDTTCNYNAAGNVTNTVSPDGTTETRSYTAAGDLASVEKGGITNTFAYDIMGNRIEAAVNGMTVSQSSFDALGRTIATTNADGVSATNTWNEWSELTKTAYTGETCESFAYGDRGMTSATDRLGIATTYERDTLGRVARTTDGEGHTVEVAYATNGTDQVESLTDANGNRTTWTYDEWGRKTGKAYADNSGETYAYDALGRMTNKLDPAGVATVFAYDANGNLTSLQRGNESAFAFGYDALDRRTNMTDAVGTTGWRYDELGRVTGETGPFGTPEVQVAYDANGRMTNVVWGTYEASYAYDALGRITTVTAPEGTYAFTYHANGIRRASVAYPNGVAETRTHDDLARVTGLAFASGTNEWLSVAYAYDAGDRRTNETWSTGREMAYGYDAAHQLTEVEAARASDAARYAYDPAGNPVERAELGFEVTNAFNNLNQILSGTWTGSTITAVGAVNYPAGTVTVGGASGTIYPDKTFDAAGVPVHLGVNFLTNVFTDVFGRSVTNATSVTIANRAYVHDANGNLTSDGVFQYQYDTANQLTNVVRTADGARVLSARYDALGRRVEAIRADGSVERYVYFPGSFLVLAVLDGSNAVKEVYTRGPDLSGSLDGAGGIGGILAVTDSASVVRYYHADIMGNVIALTDASGSVAATFRYTPFGQLSARTGSVLPRYLFSSKEFDRTANLYYYGYRYYAPRLGRWMTRDPIGELGGLNLFGFVQNCPVRSIDYLGTEFEDLGYYTVFDLFAAHGLTDADFTVDAECVPVARHFLWMQCCRCELKLTKFHVRVQTKIPLYNVPNDYVIGSGAPIPRYAEDFITDTILHEAKHRKHFGNWHDENLPQAEADFRGTYKCEKCEEKKADLRNEWQGKWQTFWDGESQHSNPGWEGWTLSGSTYAPEDDWWKGYLPLPLDDSFDDPLGEF